MRQGRAEPTGWSVRQVLRGEKTSFAERASQLASDPAAALHNASDTGEAADIDRLAFALVIEAIAPLKPALISASIRGREKRESSEQLVLEHLHLVMRAAISEAPVCHRDEDLILQELAPQCGSGG